MISPPPPTDPEGLALYRALAKEGPPTGEEVYNAVQGTRNMAGQTIAALIEAWRTESNARFEVLQRENAALRTETTSRFEALTSRFEALQRENAALRWMLGIGFTALALLIALLKLLD